MRGLGGSARAHCMGQALRTSRAPGRARQVVAQLRRRHEARGGCCARACGRATACRPGLYRFRGRSWPEIGQLWRERDQFGNGFGHSWTSIGKFQPNLVWNSANWANVDRLVPCPCDLVRFVALRLMCLSFPCRSPAVLHVRALGLMAFARAALLVGFVFCLLGSLCPSVATSSRWHLRIVGGRAPLRAAWKGRDALRFPIDICAHPRA